MSEEKVYKFSGVIQICVYKSENFSVYGISVDSKKYPDIKLNTYKNVSIIGDLPELSLGAKYDIDAIETTSKNGISYKVINIRRDIPAKKEDIHSFLTEILTVNQADTLLKFYPNIIDIVKSNECDKVDLSKLNGIGEKTFEKIKNKIVENFALMDIIVEFKGLLSMSMVKRIYDEYTSVDVLKDKLKKQPYKTLTQISRVGFKTADALIIKIQAEDIIDFGYDVKTSSDRCLACTLYLLQENENNGSTKMNLVELRKEVIKLVPECAEHYAEVIKDKFIYYNKGTLDIALRKTYECEKYIAEKLVGCLQNKSNMWDYDIEKYRKVNGFNLSDEQIMLLDSVCKNQITILTAAAGCGKSFSTQALINMLKDNKKSFILTTPTGKSAKKLSEYTKEQANTIHRTLCYTPKGFMYNEDNKLDTDIIIVDEIGMMDVFLFVNLLKALNENTKIVLIGDVYQLNSCGAGCILRDLTDSNILPHITFTKVFRLGEGGALTACTYVRQNHKFINKNKTIFLGNDKSYVFIPSKKTDINTMIVQLYNKLLENYDYKDITVISSYNKGENGCDKLNTLLQPIANKKCLSNNNYISVIVNKNEVKYFSGDSVISNVNNYHAEILNTNEETFIANGTSGIIKNIDKANNRVIINFDGIDIVYKREQLQTIKHSFALSCHKMQGSQNKIIIFCCPSSHIFFLNNNLIYTSLSRAQERIYHFSDVKTINVAMNKSDNNKRRTFLCDLLKKYGE